MKLFSPSTWFRKPKAARPTLQKEVRGEYIEVGNGGLRRFEAAQTNRQNKHHWIFANGQSINADLFEDLEKLQARAGWEAVQNALVHGAIETLACDIFGSDGPTLRILSDDTRFNDQLEGVWGDVWEMPDPNGRMSGVEYGYGWVRALCTAGSFVNVFANVDRMGPVRFGWASVHPRRLKSPAHLAADPLIAFGQRVTETGRPVEYYISKHSRFGYGMFDGFEYDTLPAKIVQHRYVLHEPEQLTGFPWLTPCLNTVADLRDLDNYVMQAAKLAAISSKSLETSSPEFAVDPEDLTGVTLEWDPAAVNISPKGWKWVSHESTQPSAEYASFRHERLRELGLALGMPLMMVLMSSADSNFASAHYDGAVYMRRVRAIQHWISTRTLKPLLQQVIAELAVQGRIRLPSKWQLQWSWPTPPYVNPEKQSKADRMAIEDGVKSVQQVILENGGDPDAVIQQRAEWAQQLETNDLPPAPDVRAASSLMQLEQQGEIAEEELKIKKTQANKPAPKPQPAKRFEIHDFVAP